MKNVTAGKMYQRRTDTHAGKKQGNLKKTKFLQNAFRAFSTLILD